jgi:hypothetical protein
VFTALADLGIVAEPVLYRDDARDVVGAQLLTYDGVLVWVDPVSGDRNRALLNELLRDVAARGVWVSAHPDTIDKIGTKEVLYRTKHLGWGTDTYRYATAAAFATEFPKRLSATGARVLKEDRSNGGQGVWKVEMAGSSRVRVQHAAPRDQVTHEVPLGEFMRRFDGCFADGGLIDQPFLARIREGMVRAYVVVDKVVGFARQRPDPTTTANVLGLPSAKAMSGAGDRSLRALRSQLETDWVSGLCRATGLAPSELPLLWDADFVYGAKTATGDDTYVLCEINVSSVLPFPDDTPRLLANAVERRMRSGPSATAPPGLGGAA